MIKRGMISVFIIVGIVILLVFALVFSIYKGILPSVMPKRTDSITTFTETCMETIVHNGLEIMELQGGYIELPEELLIADAYLDLGFKVPYWFFDGRDYMPTYKIMEDQLKAYLDEELPICLDNFQGFPQYKITPLNNITNKITFAEDRVLIDTNYHLMVEQTVEETTYLEEFNGVVISKFPEYYDLARAIMEHENRYYFLENYTDEMIASSDWLPYEGMFLSCTPQSWRVPEMMEYTQQMIMHNLHFLMFENTDYEETGIPYYDGQYKVDVTNHNFRDIKVDVIYNPSWGMEYEVLPSRNGQVKPFEFKIAKYLRSCMQVYHHKYNVEYPVMIKLDGEGKFFFATPVMLRQNLPNRYHEVNPFTLDVDEVGSRMYCADSTKITSYTLDSNNIIRSSPAIVQNRQYNLRVFTEDALTGDVLPGVNISYQCVNFRCDIGVTMYPLSQGMWTGGLPMLDTKFPNCLNGLVIADRPGYHTGREFVSVSERTDKGQVTVQLHPVKDYKVSVRVIEDHNGLITERGLRPEESVLINVNNDDLVYEQSIVHPSKYFENISLIIADLTHELDIKLVTNESYLGGLELNWSTSAQDLAKGRVAVFYVIKYDPPVPPSTPEEYEELYNYPKRKSKEYPPKII